MRFGTSFPGLSNDKKEMIMTAIPSRQAKRPLAWSRALLPALFLGLLPLSASAAPTNTVNAIQTVHPSASVTMYTITVTSTDEFPMTDSLVTLGIGGKEFTNSAYGPGGTTNTLVFSLTSAQFKSLSNGDKIVVYYGADNATIPAAQWSFGTLDLSLLDKPAASTQTPAKGK